MAGQMGLGPITDIISYTLPFEVVEKLRLLSDSNVDSRAAELVRLLRSGSINLQSVSTADFSDNARGKQEFPPPFSLN